jgi:type I restriction enzyme S subunit
MITEKFKDLFWFGSKSKVKAGDGLKKGRFPFYTSSPILSKWIDTEQYFDEALVFGTGGLPSVHYVNEPFSTSTDCLVAIAKNDKSFNLKYVYFLIFGNIRLLEEGFKGAGLKHISKKYIQEIEIPLPDIEKQNKIVAILDKAKGILDKREKTIAIYEELLKATFLEMFGDPVLNENGWELKSFNDIGKFKSGGTPDKSNLQFWEGSFPWVSPKDMKVSTIYDSQDHISESVFDKTNLKRIEPNHLLIVVRGMILAHSFPTAINSIAVSINQDMKAIKLYDDINILFLQVCLDAMKSRILDLISTAGHGTKKFDSEAISKLQIPIPPYELQMEFAIKAELLSKVLGQIRTHQKKAKDLLKSLSQQVFNERITIDVDTELEALINSVELKKKDEENKINSIINDLTFIQRLIDRLNEQEFEDKNQYDKGKYIIFRIMKEKNDLIKQIFKDNKIQLTLQNETA